MRDFGIVRTRFWEWAKRKRLSSAERELALYLLTCPHGNSVGCFRLPAAYAADDLGWDVETVRQTVSKLFRIGFLKHEKASGWTWLPGYLEHNPIPNGNVAKNAQQFIELIPSEVEFYQEFIAHLQEAGKHFDKPFLNRMANRSPKGMPNTETETETERETENKTPAPADASAECAAEETGEDSTEADFAEWYAAYPRRIDRVPALKAYRKARKSADAETLLMAAQRFAKTCTGKDRQFIKHPSTWLNNQCWLNEGDPEEPDIPLSDGYGADDPYRGAIHE